MCPGQSRLQCVATAVKKPSILIATPSLALVFAQALSLVLGDVGEVVLWIDNADAAERTITTLLAEDDERLQLDFLIDVSPNTLGYPSHRMNFLERYLRTTRPERCFLFTERGFRFKFLTAPVWAG